MPFMAILFWILYWNHQKRMIVHVTAKSLGMEQQTQEGGDLGSHGTSRRWGESGLRQPSEDLNWLDSPGSLKPILIYLEQFNNIRSMHFEDSPVSHFYVIYLHLFSLGLMSSYDHLSYYSVDYFCKPWGLWARGWKRINGCTEAMCCIWRSGPFLQGSSDQEADLGGQVEKWFQR